MWGLAVGQTVSWGVLYYAFSVLLVPMQHDLGWSRSVLVAGFTVAVVISGLLAPAVGGWLDRAGPRAVMGSGSLAAVTLVVAWSQVGSVPAYLAVWAGIGAAMALVLYEPGFTVIAKRYAPHHHRALTTLTLVAGTSSFIFQPLTSAFTAAHGWRTGILMLAGILAVVTIPLHLTLLPATQPTTPPLRTDSRQPLGDGRFWALTTAFAASAITSFGSSVLLVAYLVDHGWPLGQAALAAGTLGVMQLPGRLLYASLRLWLEPAPLARIILALPGIGVIVLWLSGGSPAIWAAVVLLGAGQGMTTLFRATLLVDLYGTLRIGALNGMSATPVVLARALAPLGVSILAGATGGYTAPFLILVGFAGVSITVAGRALTGCARTPARQLRSA